MSAALRFRERMTGYVAFGAADYDPGYRRGRSDRTHLRLRLAVAVDDVDRFVAGPSHRALVRGTVDFPELGGVFPIRRGQLRLFPRGADPHLGRIHYCVGFRTGLGHVITVRGYKRLRDDPGVDWRDATQLLTRVLVGEPDGWDRLEEDASDDEVARTMAMGKVRLTAAGVLADLTSFRPKARSRLAGAVAVARFCGAFADNLLDYYTPRRPEPARLAEVPRPAGEAVQAFRRKRKLEDGDWPFELEMEPVAVDRESPEPLPVELRHVTRPGAKKPGKGPVLLIAGSSVGADIFGPPGVPETILHRLLLEGYDVWVENWRGSLGNECREYTLDEAAAFDHPTAVDTVLDRTGADTLKAVVHCLGSSGFMLALASGRMGKKVTHVVSNSVSLHPVIPRAAEIKLRAMTPVYARFTRYLDPQWARERPLTDAPDEGAPVPAPREWPTSVLASLLVNWVGLTHPECASPVCGFGQFMYGSGPSTLYDEKDLRPKTKAWMEDQLSWAPMRLYRQLARSQLAGYLVPMREWPADVLRNHPLSEPPETNARITFITGTHNRTFSPAAQWRTYEWFASHQPGRHDFRTLPGYGHLDVWLRPDVAPVHEAVVKGLALPPLP